MVGRRQAYWLASGWNEVGLLIERACVGTGAGWSGAELAEIIMNTTTNEAAIAENIATGTVDASIRGIADPVASGAVERRSPRLRKAAVEEKRQKKTAPASAVNKTAIVLKKLKTPRGATVEALMQATGWQAHSVRGFLSGTVRKKLALTVISEIAKDGVRRYRIDGHA